MEQTSNQTNIIRTVTGFRDILDMIVRQEQEMLDCINAELKALPKGTLCLWQKKEKPDKTYFSLRNNGKNRGITHDVDLIYKLARSRYLSIVGPEVEADLAINKRIALEILERRKRLHKKDEYKQVRDLLEEYAAAGLDIARITMTPEQYNWMHSFYPSNEMNPEELIYETYSGIKMRSKSERDIGNKLELYGIPYRYEQAMTLDILWMDDEYGQALYSPKTYYPDFLIMTFSGELIIWEHLGRVDLYNYRSHNMEKICAYRGCGEFDSRHLILTFESDLQKLDSLDEIIKNHILIL